MVFLDIVFAGMSVLFREKGIEKSCKRWYNGPGGAAGAAGPYYNKTLNKGDTMRYSKKRAAVYSLLKWLQVEFFGFFVMLFFWAVAKAMGMVANVMFGFSGLMCVVCIMADFAYKQGASAGSDARLHGGQVKRGFGLVLGLIAVAPNVVTALLLVLSKAGIIGNFVGGYKILNACIFPLMDIWAHSADIKDLPWAIFILIGIYLLLYPLSSYIGIRLAYDRVDVKEKVVYKSSGDEG